MVTIPMTKIKQKQATTNSIFSDFDKYLIGEGTHERAYEKMGAHLTELNGQTGVHFAVWAPNAANVSVVGDFNSWDSDSNYVPHRQRHLDGVHSRFGRIYRLQVSRFHPKRR